MMMPGQMTHAPMAPHSAAPAQSPLVALLAAHAAQMQHPPAAMHPGGMPGQAPGAPLPLGAGGHPAARAGHAPMIMPGA